MYESYWGLTTRPFDQRAGSAFYYPADGHQAVLVKLRYALEHGCAAAIAGASGTGKSLLVDILERQLADRGQVFVRLNFPLLSAAEMLGYLADRLTLDGATTHAARPADQSLARIEGALALLGAEEKRVVVVVDEAQAIEEPQTLEALRLLLNLESDHRPTPGLVLVGETRLLKTLARMPSLEERLTGKCLLPALSAEETASYIVHRLQAAGATRDIFDGSALEAVFALAAGVPRRINRLCDLALLVGYAEEQPMIAAEQIEAVATDLQGAPMASGRERLASELPAGPA